MCDFIFNDSLRVLRGKKLTSPDGLQGRAATCSDRHIPARRPWADRAPGGSPAHSACQLLLQVLSGRVAFHAGIGGQDHFLDHSQADAIHQLVDAQIIRADALDGRKHSMQYMIFAGETLCFFEHQYIQRFFHHAQTGAVTLGGVADLALLLVGKGNVETFLAQRDPGFQPSSASARFLE